MKKAKILVVEDDPDVIVFVEDQLEHLGYKVNIAHNGVEALEKVKKSKPDLIVLDVMMPEMDGYEVCDHLKSSQQTKDIPILMLTAKGQLQDKVKGFRKGVDDYLPKPYDKAEFEARVIALLKRFSHPPYKNNRNHSVFSILCKSDRNLNIRFTGNSSFSAISKKELDLDSNTFARYADNVRTLHDGWRFHCKETGKQLYQKLFGDHPEAFSTYHRAVEATEFEEALHFRFDSDRDFLRVPLEFLFGDEEYFVLKHPLKRAISGIHIKKQLLSTEFLNELWLKNEKLRILLIASNTKPDIPGVDYEIMSLQTFVKSLFEEKGISVQLKTIPTSEAAYETIRKEIKNCHYHIIHYAGHGYYEVQSPEESPLFFWERSNRQGNVIRMSISELKMLLKNSDVRFVYLSCCLGTATGESSKLLDDDFLGIADGLIQAGIPSVLGFRWPVSDRGAKILAHEFYKSLAEQGQIDTALLQARCEVAMKDRDDMTWVSPILIMQD